MKKVKIVKSGKKPIYLADIVEGIDSVFNFAFNKGMGATLFDEDNNILGTMKNVFLMGNTYRVYLTTENGSGEYRFDLKKAKNMKINTY